MTEDRREATICDDMSLMSRTSMATAAPRATRTRASAVAEAFQPGDVVWTCYGAGVIVARMEKSTAWNDDQQASHENNDDKRECKIEDDNNIDTNSRHWGFYRVRLWRNPGYSIGSTALATLTPSSVIRKIPAAPGMLTSLHEPYDTQQQRTTTEPGVGSSSTTACASNNNTRNVLILRYDAVQYQYLVTPIIRDDAARSQFDETQSTGNTTSNAKQIKSTTSAGGLPNAIQSMLSLFDDPNLLTTTSLIRSTARTNSLDWVPESCVQLAPTAALYPVLETLMERAEQTAATTRQLLQHDRTHALVQQTSALVERTAGTLAEQIQGVTNSNSIFLLSNQEHDKSSDEHRTQLQTNVVTSEQSLLLPHAMEQNVQEVLRMVKNEQFAALLEQSKQRLEQLVQIELPAASKVALEKMGIQIQPEDLDVYEETGGSNNHGNQLTLTKSIHASRKKALASLKSLLKEVQADDLVDGMENAVVAVDLKQVRAVVAEHFSTAFDSLSMAAKSDRDLQHIFATIQEQAADWQVMTGRLLQTRSATLFMEGTQRLKARAVALFQTNHASSSSWDWTDAVSCQWTKSITEGDAALARLKSLELGDAVKSRLVQAIEMRSQSLAGLDGIVAGALSQARGGSQQVHDILQSLQQNATSVAKNTHESLLAVLAASSPYRDLALMRLEGVLAMLANRMANETGQEQSLSPADLARLVQGEGGTARIFEPMAEAAKRQITHQLDLAESQIVDPNVCAVLQRVRSILSGDLTLSSVMDEVVHVLEDGQIVAASESIFQHGEKMLDALEGVSTSKALEDAIQIAQKAGITKDSVVKELEKLNMNDLIDTASEAVTDAKAREKLISSATDTALDFVLRVLPSMPVPPFDGVNDGLVYHISNLSMQGFKVKKEDIHIELAGIRATQWKRSNRSGSGSNVEISRTYSMESSDMEMMDSVKASARAKELLVIDIQNISAIIDDAVWKFEQTYMPYLKGKGQANIQMSGGSIRLAFELRKMAKQQESTSTPQNSRSDSRWQPVLCLHDRSCVIEQVGLDFQGKGTLNWILNKLVTIFRGPLRDYVVRTIVRVLTNQSGWILSRLNSILSPYWDVILRTAKLSMDDLVEADEAVIIEAVGESESNLIELVWRERLPLGMNLLMNDDSGLLKVVDFPRGSQARVVCENRGLDPDQFKGATIVAVNGSEFDDQDDLFDALKDPVRPKTVRFKLAETADMEKLRRFVEGPKIESENSDERIFQFKTVDLVDGGDLGVEFGSDVDCFGLRVSKLLRNEDGTLLAMERTGKIRVGDILCYVNGSRCFGSDKDSVSVAIELLQQHASHRPLSLSFSTPYLHRVQIPKPSSTASALVGGPEELILSDLGSRESRKRVGIVGFKNVSGMAERSGILIGDHLVFINGLPVGAGCRWLGDRNPPTFAEVFAMLQDFRQYPMGLTFARPRVDDEHRRWRKVSSNQPLMDRDALTICVTADSRDLVGCVFIQTEMGDICVRDFQAIPGLFQRALQPYRDERGKIKTSIEALDGEMVPSYGTADMVRSALRRAWESHDLPSMELCLSDDERRDWLHSIIAKEDEEQTGGSECNTTRRDVVS